MTCLTAVHCELTRDVFAVNFKFYCVIVVNFHFLMGHWQPDNESEVGSEKQGSDGFEYDR